MREHFFDKYFAYRRKYVEHIEREAPHRARLAASAEAARLAFLVAASLLNALLLWLLFVGTLPGGLSFWSVFAFVTAAVMTASAVSGTIGVWKALRERRRLSRPPS